ncbi:MAG: ATP-binding cassette domain-containing protein, partial [Methylococcaceae bacterium]|nr:ATP-binding cassette domain-containing protein [Methylococcaceae bacterium]
MTTAHAIDMSAVFRGQQDKSAKQPDPCLKVENLNLFYGTKQALHNVNMDMPKQRVTAYIGPSGCGKSTLLRCIN